MRLFDFVFLFFQAVFSIRDSLPRILHIHEVLPRMNEVGTQILTAQELRPLIGTASEFDRFHEENDYGSFIEE